VDDDDAGEMDDRIAPDEGAFHRVDIAHVGDDVAPRDIDPDDGMPSRERRAEGLADGSARAGDGDLHDA